MSVNEGYDFIVNEVKTVVEKHVPLKGNNKNIGRNKVSFLKGKSCPVNIFNTTILVK